MEIKKTRKYIHSHIIKCIDGPNEKHAHMNAKIRLICLQQAVDGILASQERERDGCKLR